MKHFTLPVLSAALLLSFSDPGKEKQVTGKVTHTAEYCGGAKPDKATLEELQKPKPLGGKKFFIRKGNKNSIKEPVVASFVTDAEGNFSVLLPPGEYCIIESRKYDKEYVADIAKNYKKAGANYSAADLNCLKEWLAKPDAVFNVNEKGENKVEVVYHDPCSWNATPCVQYTGPTPP